MNLKPLFARSIAHGAALVLMLGLTACGGGGGGGGSTTPPPTVTLSSIAMSPASATLAVAGTQQLTVTGTYSDGSTKNLTSSATYASSATGTATVSASGDVTAIAPGSATITASDGGFTATTTITVDAAAPTLSSIAVAPPSVTLAIGATQALTVTGTYTDQSTKNVTSSSAYQSSATSIATVTSPGAVVTAVAAGSATITVTNSGKTATMTVTVSPPPAPTLTSITVSAPSTSLNLGSGTTLVVTGHYSDNSTQTLTSGETFQSSSLQVANVGTTNGVVAPVGIGTAVMTATDTASGKTATVTITVSAAANSGYVFYNDFAPGVTYTDNSTPSLPTGQVDTVVLNAASNGRASFRITIPSGFISGGGTANGIFANVSTAQDLRGFNALQFWAKVDVAPMAGVETTGIGENSNFTVEVDGLPVTTGWKHFTIPLPDPSKAASMNQLFHFIELDSAYTLWLSDIQYVLLPSSAIAPVLANAQIPEQDFGLSLTSTGGELNSAPLGSSSNTVPYTAPMLPNGAVSNVGFGWFTFVDPTCNGIASISTSGVITALGVGTCTVNAQLQSTTLPGTVSVVTVSP